MTPEHLLKIMADELRSVADNFTFEAEYQRERKVRVYEQILPKSNFASDTYYPLVLAEINAVEDNAEDSYIYFTISVGVYCGEDDNAKGYLDLLNLAEAIRQHLLRTPVIGQAMVFDFPLTLEVEPNQPYPFAYCYVNCQYRIVRVRN